MIAETPDPEALLEDYRRAEARRRPWEALWRDCAAHALPYGTEGAARIYDATAADASDQLAASLLAELTPPFQRWVGFEPGSEAGPGAAAQNAANRTDCAAEALEAAAVTVQGHLDRSAFAVEMHQALLDLVVLGTGCLLFEESALGAASAFRFTAVPLTEAVLEEGPEGRLDRVWRRRELGAAALRARFPRAPQLQGEGPFGVVECVAPEAGGADAGNSTMGGADAANSTMRGADAANSTMRGADAADSTMRRVMRGGGTRYRAVLEGGGGRAAQMLAEGRFAVSPFICFRWLKAPGEVYGRSPVMKALPDIKTADKVVELILKNASIAATGIWQADDDGVLDPSAVELVPGAIIPKAVGSAGLTPLAAPGRFDVSQLVLEDLRKRIRHALLADRLAEPASPAMTATEVLERAAETARLLGATYGRLEAELLTPLIERALSILARRGEVPAFALDGRQAGLRLRSPLAQAAGRREAGAALTWLGAVAGLGPEALAAVDTVRIARWLGARLGVPPALLEPPELLPGTA